MGCDNTTLLVSNGSKIWVRNVPVGGNHFTRALTKEMKLSFAKAEHLKCNATKSPDPRAVFQALRPVFNDYVSEIQRSIGFFSSVNRQAKISKVIGYGNGFKLAGLQKFLQQNLQYDVERPDTFRSLSGDSVLNAPLFQENMLGFAVPYGLALQTLGLTRIRTSLLPPEIATAREVRRKKPWAVLTAAALLSGVALSMIFNGRTYSAVHSEPWAEAVSEADALGTKVDGWKSEYEAAEGAFNGVLSEAEALVEGRHNMLWPEVYKAINECLPRERGDQKDNTDIKLRNRINITSITNEHVADVGEWYKLLLDDQKATMSEQDRQTAPQGEGYIFTLEGEHYHDEELNPQMQGLFYVVNAFLKSETGLQNWTITAEDGTPQDVGRLGISHVRAEQLERYKVEYDPRGPDAALAARDEGQRTDLFGSSFGRPFSGANPGRPGLGGRRGFANDEEDDNDTGSGRSRGRRGRTRTAPGRGQPFDETDENIERIWKTDFIVEFVWQKKPGERPEKQPAAAEPDESAEDTAETTSAAAAVSGDDDDD